MRTIRAVLPATLVLAALGAFAPAQIKRLTLPEMVQDADQAIYGQIIGSHAFRLDDPIDGPELYFTTITIQGRLLASGQTTTVDVTFRGGFVSETEGVFNSEAPAADDVKVGKRVVAFYRWSDNIGAGRGANVLMAAHGGIYRTVHTSSGPAVLGRGPGYAISSNRYVEQLESAVKLLAVQKSSKR